MKNALLSVSRASRSSRFVIPAHGAHAEPVAVPAAAVLVNVKENADGSASAQVKVDLIDCEAVISGDKILAKPHHKALVCCPRGFKSKHAESGKKADADAEEGMGHFTVAAAAVALEAEPAKAAA